jgi:hypothetical protein
MPGWLSESVERIVVRQKRQASGHASETQQGTVDDWIGGPNTYCTPWKQPAQVREGGWGAWQSLYMGGRSESCAHG